VAAAIGLNKNWVEQEMRRNDRPLTMTRPVNRTAFTMLELLLVLGVVVVILAVAWPNVLRLTGQQSLIDSSEKVRALAASARVHAIDSGLVYQFRYEPGGRHFVAVPFEREFESVSPNARGTGTALGRFSKASGTLPEGVTFAAPTALNSTGSGSSTTAGLGQKISSAAFSGLPDAGKLENVSWSGPILFQPDGSAGDAAVDLVDRRNQRITMRIRGVTGAVSVSRLHQMERP
jgi:type II secretory pathway pseudopilin PulG